MKGERAFHIDEKSTRLRWNTTYFASVETCKIPFKETYTLFSQLGMVLAFIKKYDWHTWKHPISNTTSVFN